MGVRRVDDPLHPRGYRELRSNGEMRKFLNRKIADQNGICGICNEKFTDCGDVVPDHGRRLAGRSPGQHSGRALVVQRREGIEPRLRDHRSRESRARKEKEDYGIHSTGKFIVRN